MKNKKKTLANINILFNARTNSIKFIEKQLKGKDS